MISKDKHSSFPVAIRRGISLDAASDMIITLHKNTFVMHA